MKVSITLTGTAGCQCDLVADLKAIEEAIDKDVETLKESQAKGGHRTFKGAAIEAELIYMP